MSQRTSTSAWRRHCHMAWLIFAVLRMGLPASAHDAFATTFPFDERPISDGDAWHHLGTRWALVRTEGGHAVGMQTGHDGYDDSYAHLRGFRPDQTAEATLWLDPATTGDYREVELLLHWADTATAARGYECNLAWNGAYAEIVRWNGPFGDFTYITQETRFAPGVMPPRSGDLFKATITGDVIRVFIDKNDGQGYRLIATGRDGRYTDGDPGMGFFIQGVLDPSQFGFSRFSAWSE